MARATPRKPAKAKAKARAKPRPTARKAPRAKEPMTAFVPLGVPPPVEPPPPPRKATEAELLEAARPALAAALARAWHKLAPVALPPVDGVEVQAALWAKGRPHWHLVTQGLAKKGLELSLRAARRGEELAPPAWAHALLATLVKRALAGEQRLDNNQSISLGGPLAPNALGEDGDTELTGVALALDPVLGVVPTAVGALPVLQVVGITADEERLSREWSPRGLLEVLSKVDPLLVTDLERTSLLLSPRARLLIEQRVEREGSSMGVLRAKFSELKKAGAGVTWRIDPEAADTIVSLLKGRIGHLRGFSVQGSQGARADVVPADRPQAELTREALTLKLSQSAARAMRATLKGKSGKYTWDVIPGLTVEVV